MMTSQFSFIKILLLLVLIGLFGFAVYAFSPNVSSVTQTSAAIATGAAITIVNQSDRDKTITLAKGEMFAIEFGNALKWTFSFDPADAVRKVSDAADIQGIFEAEKSETFVIHATGAPICKAGEMCPMFLQAMTIDFVIN